MAETNQQPTTALVSAQVKSLSEFLQAGLDSIVKDLDGIETIDSDEKAAEAEHVLSLSKKVYDKMSAKRKSFTDPIKAEIEKIMTYENQINYNSKTENKYTRARKVLEAWQQKKIDEKKKKEYEAWLVAEQLKYKAEYRGKIEKALTEMLAGLHKTLISNMMVWESNLTLETIDTAAQKLKESKPALKIEYFAKCFKPWMQRPEIMSMKQEEEFLKEVQKDLSYDKYNEEYAKIVAPIKNEYLAKIPALKQHLEEVKVADDKKKAELQKKLDDEREAKRLADIKAVDDAAAAKEQEIRDKQEMEGYHADFTQQAMTSDLDAGPSKKAVSFADDKLWLKPLLEVISKVAVHKKFKGIKDTKGNVRKELQWWLDQYASCIGEPMEGLNVEEVAKTIIRNKE
jgi:hypothetical protein